MLVARRTSGHSLEWKLMAVSLAMLGTGLWMAAKPPEPTPIAVTLPVLPVSGMSGAPLVAVGVSTQDASSDANISSANVRSALPDRVAFKEEK